MAVVAEVASAVVTVATAPTVVNALTVATVATEVREEVVVAHQEVAVVAEVALELKLAKPLLQSDYSSCERSSHYHESNMTF